ncbi:MAG TPA: hypothetical protein VIJ66_01485 [Solirubrobacteraceae bacterium]
MLFDLRGRGRRRTVQVIYVGLALLFGVGFIGFGVGVGSGGGGILNALTGESGAPKASFAGQVKKYEKLVAEQPKSLSAWEGLINAQLHEAGGESSVSNGKLTSEGKGLFSDVARSWSSYLALNPPKPNPKLAKEMLRVFDEEGLNQASAEVQVLQIVVANEPQSAALFGQLAEYAYKAHNERQGDLAAEKAVSLAPASGRARLKKELAELKKSSASTSTTTASGASSGSTGAASGGLSGTSSSGSTGTGAASSGEAANATITVGGKSYKVSQKVKEQLESSTKK